MKTSLRMIVVLGLISAICAGLLAGVNLWTKPIIEENSRVRLTETLAQVIEADEFIEQEGAEVPLWHAQKGGSLVGYVVRMVGYGYSSDGIDMLIGLDANAAVTGVFIFSHSETPGLGEKATKPDFLQQFEGKGINDPIASGTDVDAISGATSSSMAVIGTVRKAVQFVGRYAGLIEDASIDFAQVPDGVYTGTGRGFGGEIVVEVTFAGGELTDVKIVSHSETSGVSDPAISQLPQSLVDQQTLDVDTVSGATMSSNGILDAVRNALAEFGGGSADKPIDITTLLPGKYTGTAKGLRDGFNVEVTVAGGKISEIKVLSNNDTPEYADQAIAGLIPSIIDAQSLEVDLISGASFSSQGLLDAVKNALRSEVVLDLSGLGDGEYSGEAEGFSREPIRITFAVKNGKIESVLVTAHNDTPGVAEPAFEQLIASIIEGQTLDVDAVSGASFSSQGFLDAMMNAIKNGPTLDVSALPDGVYQGTGNGLFGEIKVQVTLSGGKITDITSEHTDTEEFANNAISTLKTAIVDGQTTEVDLVSGASGTSRGFLEAVEAALKSAAQ